MVFAPELTESVSIFTFVQINVLFSCLTTVSTSSVRASSLVMQKTEFSKGWTWAKYRKGIMSSRRNVLTFTLNISETDQSPQLINVSWTTFPCSLVLGSCSLPTAKLGDRQGRRDFRYKRSVAAAGIVPWNQSDNIYFAKTENYQTQTSRTRGRGKPCCILMNMIGRRGNDWNTTVTAIWKYINGLIQHHNLGRGVNSVNPSTSLKTNCSTKLNENWEELCVRPRLQQNVPESILSSRIKMEATGCTEKAINERCQTPMK